MREREIGMLQFRNACLGADERPLQGIAPVLSFSPPTLIPSSSFLSTPSALCVFVLLPSPSPRLTICPAGSPRRTRFFESRGLMGPRTSSNLKQQSRLARATSSSAGESL
jgi:hypothetical protein